MGCGMDVGLLGDRMSAHEHSARRCMQEAERLPEAAFTALTVALRNDSELSVTFTSGRESSGQPLLCKHGAVYGSGRRFSNTEE